jgi:hypothetical protein
MMSLPSRLGCLAQLWIGPLITNRNLTDTHDLEFLAKPFKSAVHLDDEKIWIPLLQNMSMNLTSRYVPPLSLFEAGYENCQTDSDV